MNYDFFSIFLRPKSYVNEARWAGFRTEECLNPKLLYQNVIAKLHDLVPFVYIYYFNKDYWTKSTPKKGKENAMWSAIDFKEYGRCYTLKIPQKFSSYGIKEIRIYVYQRSMIFIHNHGMLATERTNTVMDITDKRKIDAELEHEVFHMLDFGGHECLNDTKYDRDMCAHEKLFQVKTRPNENMFMIT